MTAQREFNIADVSAFLLHVAEATGDQAYRRAARALTSKAGRPPLADADLLAEADAIRESRPGLSLHAVLRLVARARVPRRAVDSTVERLRRKHNSTKILSGKKARYSLPIRSGASNGHT